MNRETQNIETGLLFPGRFFFGESPGASSRAPAGVRLTTPAVILAHFIRDRACCAANIGPATLAGDKKEPPWNSGIRILVGIAELSAEEITLFFPPPPP